MGSARASTTAGRRRTAKRAARGPQGRAPGASATRKPAKRAGAGAKRPAAKRAARPRPAKRTASAARRPRPAPGRRPAGGASGRRRLRERLLSPAAGVVALALAACLAAGYWLWLRDSPLVAVERVAVTGVEGPGSEAVVAALTEAGRSMTTLNVDEGELEAAVAGLPLVAGLSADADFPHGLTIAVEAREPAILARDPGGRELPVAGDGTVLAGLDLGPAKLPRVAVAKLPRRGTLAGEDLALARVAGAAPEPLRPLIAALEYEGEGGVTATLRGDVPVLFGSADRAAAKWAAAAAILARPRIDTLTYLDVRVPERPAIGGAALPAGAAADPAVTPLEG